MTTQNILGYLSSHKTEFRDNSDIDLTIEISKKKFNSQSSSLRV